MELSKYIKQKTPIEGITTREMNTGNNEIITIAGSFPGGDLHSPSDNPLIAEFTAKMLDEGTKSKTKQQLAEELEEIGAKIDFDTDVSHTKFKARCRKKDTGRVIGLIAEQLKEPTFPEKQLGRIKQNSLTNLEQERENTRARAMNELTRMIYTSEHPNYTYSIDKRMNFVKKLTSKDLKNFHKKYYSRGGMKIALTGSVNTKVNQKITQHFKNLECKTLPQQLIRKQNVKRDTVAKTHTIQIPEKESVDVVFGESLPISKDHEDYPALLVGMAVLGYGFMGRLMRNVRNRKGLTYGTGARLKGFEDMQDGYWIALGMFAPKLLNEGIEAMRKEIIKLINKGVAQKELGDQKTHVIGLYKLMLSNTEELAEKILKDLEDGRDPEYIDKFVEKINSVTRKEVNEALKKYCDPNKIQMAAAGTI